MFIIKTIKVKEMIANLKSCDWNTNSPSKEMCNWEQYEEYAYLCKGVKGW